VPELLERLLARCDRRLPAVVRASDLEQWSPATWRSLAASGLLHQVAPSRWGFCQTCDDASPQPVLSVDRGHGDARYYIGCPNCGSRELTPQELELWELVWDQWLLAIGQALGVRGTIRAVVPDGLWRLGWIKAHSGNWQCFVARGLHRRNVAAALREIDWPPRTLLFVPVKLPSTKFGLPDSAVTLPLAELFDWQPPSLVCDTSWLDASLPGTPVAPLLKRKSKRAERTHDIGILTRVLIEHLRSARDHVQAAIDHGREPQLLPRPTQRELARLAGFTEVRVSRCLRDAAARELRMLWEGANDLDTVLRMGGKATG